MATVNSSAAVLEAGELTSSDELVKGICPVCLSEFCDPRLLDCLHSVCLSCLEAMAVTGGDQLRCPLCRTTSRLPEGGVAALPGDLTVPVSSENADECLLCDSSSRSSSEQGPQFWCSECSVVICSSHLVLHMSTDGSHNIQNCDASSRTRSGADVSISRARLDCSKHVKKLEYFCVSCDACICADCAITGSHSGHKPIVNVKAIVAERKELVSRDVSKMVDKMERLEQGVKAVNDVMSCLSVRADEVRCEIRTAGDQAKQAIDDQVCRLLQEVQDVEDSRTKSLDNQVVDLKRQLKNAKGVIRFSNRLSENGGDGMEVMPSLLALQKRVSSIMTEEISEKPKQNADLDIVVKPVSEPDLKRAVSEILCFKHATIATGDDYPFPASRQGDHCITDESERIRGPVVHCQSPIPPPFYPQQQSMHSAAAVSEEVTSLPQHHVMSLPQHRENGLSKAKERYTHKQAERQGQAVCDSDREQSLRHSGHPTTSLSALMLEQQQMLADISRQQARRGDDRHSNQQGNSERIQSSSRRARNAAGGEKKSDQQDMRGSAQPRLEVDSLIEMRAHSGELHYGSIRWIGQLPGHGDTAFAGIDMVSIICLGSMQDGLHAVFKF